uniref:Kelch repeat and BTB domain-containing protein 11 n=1 Tax=Leptobrachium leishanense TaxID=445787 RepID=A0A8C5R721_9ANUR
MPLLRQNSVKPFTEWDNTRRIPQFIQMCSPFPVKVVGSATSVENNVDRSLESRRDFLLNNKNVMHSSTEFSATTIYHIKYIDSLHEESSDCLHCDEHEGSTINDPSVVQRKSCENIHHQFSSQKPKLKKKTQSTLCLLTQYYSSMPHSSENRLIEEVSRGSFVRIPRSLQEIGEAMRFQLTLGNCLELLKLARKNSVPELLKAVYTVISDNYLHVLKNSAIYGQLTGSDRERILQLRSRGKPSLCVVEIKSIFGWNKMGQSDEATGPCQIKAHIYALDMEKNQWNSTTCIPEEACLKGCSICTMHNYLFIAGGIRKTSEGSTCSSKLFCYNPLTDIWSQLTPMNQARSQHKLVPVDGHLYAIGGEYNKWTFKAPLPKGSFAVAHEATECGGEIYVSGGHLFYRLLKYSPAHDCWEECPYNGSKGRSCDMVATKNNLYRFDMQRDSTVSIFKYNTAAKVWTEYSANFPASKMAFRCAVLNNTIYCLNRETTAQFTDGDDEAIFEATVFSTFPSKGIGTPHPLVLSLPGSVSQTSV